VLDDLEREDELEGVNETLGIDAPILVEEPELDDILEDVKGGKTLSEAEEETPHESNLQTTFRYLQPKFKNKRMDEIAQPILRSRIFPDNFLDLNYLLTMHMLEELEDDPTVDFLAIVTGNQAVTSIAYEGMNRAEILEAMGVEREEDMEKLAKDVGLM